MIELFPDLTPLSRRALDIKIQLAELLPVVTHKYVFIGNEMITIEQAKQLRDEYDAARSPEVTE